MTGRYQPYDEYDSANEPWIEDYPKEWNLTRVKFESYVKARVGWHGLKSDDFTEEGPYLVTGSDFKGPEIVWDYCYHCDEERYKQDPYIQLKEGDLLITKDGTIGKVALVNNLEGKATLNSGVFVVRPLADNYTSRFYFWLLQSNVFTGFVDFNKTGSTIVHLYQDTFVNFRFALPSLCEQQKIADFLDHETAKIDTLIEKQQKLIELLKEKRQAVISHAVTKGLNPDAPMKDSGVEWLGEVPAHWGKSNLGVECLVKARLGWKGLKADEYVDEGFIFLATPNIKGNEIDFTNVNFITEERYEESPEIMLEIGDVLVTKDGSTTGTTNVVRYLPAPTTVNSSIAVLRSLGGLNGFYLYYFFVSTYIQNIIKRMQGGMGVPHLFQADLRKFTVLMPPLNEQVEIASYLEELLPKFDLLIDKAKQEVCLLQERRTALISAAVTGKIDVRKWNEEQA